ncbi:sulfatase-like hydrolase/transferase [Opitutus sp. ER46]|uniref:sulfatase-like hydrolase/transferase n=1 Tax=Opitutus sp. ER46 TaxID=2161864 RepID=UPI000D325708|nr:sulfatase-like hydrolase/transferase [Opitutus sp. ER46]PTX92512.1 sulfatase [Opitutus sp. ER46]
MPKPPNILWVVTTQWRAQACGYAGDLNARTPTLDALARAGADFRHAVTPHPFGPFARAALLTGRRSPENGVVDYYDPLPAGAETIAHRLAARGYATAYFGKWHLAERDREAPLVGEAHARMVVPSERRGGFGWWEGFEGGFLLNDPWLHGSGLPEPRRVPGYQSDVVGARAAAWIARADEAAERPWFCVVSVEPPHPPYGAPAGAVAPRDPAQIVLAPNVPRDGEVERRARRELAGYYAHIEATDAAIGRLLESVDRRTTVVVVTSVHGDMHGAHGLFRKGWPYEESVRVPLLVSVPPALAGAGWRGASDALVSLLDLPRWAESWADGVVPENHAAAQEISMPSIVALPHQCDRAWRAVRTGSRKRVWMTTAAEGQGSAGRPWLDFDLERDPLELHNHAAAAGANA